MQPQDISFLEQSLADFIETSINRIAHSGTMQYRYRLTAADAKTGTDRQRLHESVIDAYENFFASHGGKCEYDPNFATFNVLIDLDRCVLNPAQARQLSAAMGLYRTEHC